MFENGKVYKIKVTGHTWLGKVNQESYTLYVDDNYAIFLKPRGRKRLFSHTLDNINNWLYNHCNIEKVETVEEWNKRMAN